MDLMFLKSKAVLPIVDIATRFSAATFADPFGECYGQNFDGLWLAVVMAWCKMCSRYEETKNRSGISIYLRQMEKIDGHEWTTTENIRGEST